ncbi:MAG: DUF3131 domain-containing protein [Candidatus Bathyarchaeia archaeon]
MVTHLVDKDISAILLIALAVTFIFAVHSYMNPQTLTMQLRASQPQWKEYWLTLAYRAWNYFKPGVGVDPNTGLHKAGLYWPYFTEWDLGVYISAILDAVELGVLPREGEWGADFRIEKIISFLLNRPLGPNGVPYLWYESSTGRPYGDALTNVYDSGKLLAALYRLKNTRQDLASTIDYIVLNRTNYRHIASSSTYWPYKSNNLYLYYAALGYSSFGFSNELINETLKIPSNILSKPRIETYGVQVPNAPLIAEPLLHIIFEFPPSDEILEIFNIVYRAHEARFNSTGKYTAFSEGNTDLSNPSYVYEYVALDSETWVLMSPRIGRVNITPIVYYKIAVAFKAVYNTSYANSLADYIERFYKDYSFGIMDGVDEEGRVVATIIDKTNGLVLAAARYALKSYTQTHVDLGRYPQQFLHQGTINNTLVVIGESKPRFCLDASHTIDVLGGILIASRISLEASAGNIKVAMDGWLVSVGENGLNLLDTASNMIVVGSPGVNLVAYYYNYTYGSRNLLPVIFVRGAGPLDNYLYILRTGESYKMEFDREQLRADYGIIMILRDEYGRYVLLAYGIGAEATRAASEILRDYDKYPLRGNAIIFKYYDSDGDGKLDSILFVKNL